ncbi:MAG: hypothetical protein KIS78_19085 [Labilithrix sp.]|nr:hypothetical protein [Labilithrix sp.]
MSTAEKMNKAQRLAIAGVVAPFLREGAERAAKRRVAKVDKDGNVVGYTTLAEVQAKILERAEIEIAVQDGVRPKEVICKYCGKVIRVKGDAKGAPPRQCPDGCVRDCATPGCEGRISKVSARRRAKEGIVNGKCYRCSRREVRRKAWASKTPEQRSEIARRAAASKTPERRSEIARHAAASKTPERRSEIARQREMAKSPEERVAWARKASRLGVAARASKTPEQRSEAARKAWKTKRAKAKAKAEKQNKE